MSTWEGENRRKLPEHCQVEVLQRLAELTTQQQLITVKLQTMDVRREEMHVENQNALRPFQVFLYGNGKPGAEVRMDRIEQREQSREKTGWLVMASVIGLVIKAVFDLFLRGR